MEDLARQIGWYLSVAIFSILLLAIGGWLLFTLVKIIRRWSSSVARRLFKKN